MQLKIIEEYNCPGLQKAVNEWLETNCDLKEIKIKYKITNFNRMVKVNVGTTWKYKPQAETRFYAFITIGIE